MVAGDQAAWNALYRKHYSWLYATALSICRNSDTAKDMAQETFTQAYLKIDQLKDPVAFAGWLKTILIRSCYRNMRPAFSNTSENRVPMESLKLSEDEINDKMDGRSRQHQIA